jgi:hypothetical protein
LNIQIDVAGVAGDLEMKISLACGLLAADQLQVDMQPWKGRNCDVLIVDMQSGYGRLAYEVARRRALPVIGFGVDAEGLAARAPGLCRLDRQATVAAIVKALRRLLLPSAAAEEKTVTGLLDLCLRETGCAADLQASHGQITVVLRPAGGRIHARSVSDLLAAEARLLHLGWFSALASEPNWAAAGWHVTRSLDAFLVVACRRFQSRLPLLEHRAMRLNRWPDLGSIPDDMDSLRLAALLHRSAWSVRDLARHAELDLAFVNAFLWAALAGGSLASDELQVVTSTPHHMHHPAPSLLQRVARHFGMRLGHGHSHA